MRLLRKSTWPRTPGGQKLQPVPYPIYRSRIAIDIARSLIDDDVVELEED